MTTSSPDTEKLEQDHQDKSSDTKILLAPLGKYALAGMAIVAVIVTTAVMLERQLSNIDREMAALDSEISTSGDANTRKDVSMENADTGNSDSTVLPATENIEKAIENVEQGVDKTTSDNRTEPDVGIDTVTLNGSTSVQPEVLAPTTSTLVENAASTEFFVPFDDFMAQRNAYLKHMDELHIARMKQAQEEQIAFLRERLADKKAYIARIERQNKENYDYRISNMKELQQRREFFSNRI